MKNEIVLSVGVLLYRSEEYLPAFLESLKEQEIAFELLIGDNNEDRCEAYKAKHWFKNVRLFSFGNVGFAKGHNRLVQKSCGKYYACLNPDLVLEKGYLRSLVEGLEFDERLGSVQGQILRFDGETVDSLGLEMKLWGSVENKNEGGRLSIKDRYLIGDTSVWGVTGAAAVYRRQAFDEVGGFDENMFMYKEDVDLAYRLGQVGWGSECVGDAVAYHDRTVDSGGRKHRSLREKRWSYRHHLQFLQKAWGDFPFWKKGLVLGYEGLKLVYVSVFEWELLGEFVEWRKGVGKK
jgi:GT2 family glycosyltransferase